MSTLAEELDRRLQQLDPRTAQSVERLIRDVLALTEVTPAPSGAAAGGLAGLAAAAEPMGVLTNGDIDATVYGR